jgi:hypothetical protein
MNARTTIASALCLPALAIAAPAAAQDEAALKAAFEGKRVTVRIDMPGSAGGVDVNGDGDRTMDMQRYRTDLRHYGTAIRAGESVTVTLVKVKKDIIEFQLAGGGFGTFSDDASTSVNLPDVEKSNREKDLEKKVKAETDRDRKRELQRELSDLRNQRERENRRIAIDRQRLEEEKRRRIAEQRLRGGSRFNIRYEDRVPVGVKPEHVVATLAEFVDFRGDAGLDAPRETADITQLKKGLQRSEAERLFGRPVQETEKREGSLVITTLTFIVGEQRIAADFVEDVLVRYTITSK